MTGVASREPDFDFSCITCDCFSPLPERVKVVTLRGWRAGEAGGPALPYRLATAACGPVVSGQFDLVRHRGPCASGSSFTGGDARAHAPWGGLGRRPGTELLGMERAGRVGRPVHRSGRLPISRRVRCASSILQGTTGEPVGNTIGVPACSLADIMSCWRDGVDPVTIDADRAAADIVCTTRPAMLRSASHLVGEYHAAAAGKLRGSNAPPSNCGLLGHVA